MTVTGGVREETPDVASSSAGTAARDGAYGGFPFGDLASRAMRVVWVWPVLLTLLAGLYQVTRPELWRDELSSWSFASRPVSQLTAIVHHSDATQLGYYLLLHYWIAAFGDSVLAMRMLSVLAMAGAAACVTLVGRRLAGPRAGLLGGLVFALVPSVSRFAQETRFYALEVLVAMLATLLLLRALDQPTVRRWAGYAACLALLGYLDLVALSLIVGHLAGVALRWRETRDSRLAWFGPATVVGLAACLPVALVGIGQAGRQLDWLLRPGFSLAAFSFFGRNLFYSTAAAAALIIVAVFAWAVSTRAAAFATAIAVLPVAVVWLVSQGPYSYFFPRYLLLTVGAWALLAGIALSRLDLRLAAAGVLVFGVLGFGDQQVIREPGAHNWTSYPNNSDTGYWDYAGAARVIAEHARPGDGIAYPGNPIRWEMINFGVQYYLTRARPAGPQPRQVFMAKTAAAAGSLYPVMCQDAAGCLGQPPRMWIVDDNFAKQPYAHIPVAEATAMRAHYRLDMVRRVPGLTVFLLVRI
jgi:mannosyltransferase